MQLSRKIVSQLDQAGLDAPQDSLFTLPVRVLQFGTGVLLRGLPDYFIDKANKQNEFNGRVLVVKSTDNGGVDAFKEQDGLYTLLERGFVNGVKSEKTYINASVSSVLSAVNEWEAIVQYAADPALQIIISNTTEVGIVFLQTDVDAQQPISFPGRVLDFLQKRYTAFEGTEESGMVIIPTELIPDNGTKLKEIVLRLASAKGLSNDFLTWLDTANDFCNSLVDCIVPGKMAVREHSATEKGLGYEDQLMIMTEPYRLWAIETVRDRTKQILSFSKANPGVVIAADINKFRELKLRLLNGTHTFSCGLAHLLGFKTVKDAMNDQDFSGYISRLMLEEIAPLVVSDQISLAEATVFVGQVIDRFKNPYIEHLWLNITMQYTSKMAMRTVPLLEKHYANNQQLADCMVLGFAAFIVFMRSTKDTEGRFIGGYNGQSYPIQDDKANLLYNQWQKPDFENRVSDILKDETIFGKDLTIYPGFVEAVQQYIMLIQKNGATTTLHSLVAKNNSHE